MTNLFVTLAPPCALPLSLALPFIFVNFWFLPQAELMGDNRKKCDLCVRVRQHCYSQHTTTKKDTTSPVWKEQLAFLLIENESLVIEMVNKKSNKEAIVGVGEMCMDSKLAKSATDQALEQWVDLVADGKRACSLKLQLQVNPRGSDDVGSLMEGFQVLPVSLLIALS